MITKEKSTNELENEIKSAGSADEYLAQNSDYLLKKSISDTLNDALCKTGLSVAEIVKRSGLTKSHVYHIFSGKRLPSRDKLIAIAFGFGFDCDETNALLKKSRAALLYSKDPRDAVIMFSLAHGKSIIDANLDLEKQGFEILE